LRSSDRSEDLTPPDVRSWRLDDQILSTDRRPWVSSICQSPLDRLRSAACV